MRNNILIVTLGGSDAPVVTSIKHHKPNHVYFICSNDTEETKGSYLLVDGKGKPCGFEGPMRENIVTQTALEPSQYSVVKISLDDLNECYLKASQIIKTIRQDNPDEVINADYTGGTKSMTAGLAAAAIDDGNVNISIVKGRRVDLHKVKEGTQSARIVENNKIFIKKKLLLIENLWENYDFQSCLEVIAEMTNRPLNPDLHDSIDKIRYLCMGFEAWDRFDHSCAINHLKPYKSNDYIKNYYKLLGEINRVKECWPDQGINDLESRSKEQRVSLLSFAPVYDLILNALRREKQGRFDDAVARIYRALEMFAQINLLRWDNPLYSSNLDPTKLPADIAANYKSVMDFNGGKITLALMNSYNLLAELKTPVGLVFNEHKHKLKSLLNKRNNSLMAHGIKPVTKEDCRETIAIFENFLSDTLGSIKEDKPDFQEAQFPGDLLQRLQLL